MGIDPEHDWWLGLNDREQEGTFVWVATDEELTYSNWAPGEPNDLLGEDCVSMDDSPAGEWNDASCSNTERYVCEAW